jgi:hypothetical protein
MTKQPGSVVLVVVVGGAPPRLASEQSAIDAASAFLATNRPASSRLIVAGPKSAQLRRVPVVMRMPTPPCGPRARAR